MPGAEVRRLCYATLRVHLTLSISTSMIHSKKTTTTVYLIMRVTNLMPQSSKPVTTSNKGTYRG